MYFEKYLFGKSVFDLLYSAVLLLIIFFAGVTDTIVLNMPVEILAGTDCM